MVTQEVIQAARAFVAPYYAEKDIMHDFSHVRRVVAVVRELAKNYDANPDLLTIAAYVHGVVDTRENEIIWMLRGNGLSEEEITELRRIVWQAQPGQQPDSIESSILHDAILLEGGKTFIIVQGIVAGIVSGRSLDEIVHDIEDNRLGNCRCLLPEAQKLYEEKEAYTRGFLDDLKKYLPGMWKG